MSGLLRAPVRGLLIALTLGLYAAVLLVSAQTTRNGVTLGGAPLFYDFEAFHQAGRLAAEGKAIAAYDDARMVAAEHAAFPGTTARLPWNYPPTLQLLMVPLGLMPYLVAWLVWSAGGYAAFVLMLRRLSPGQRTPLLFLAPAAAVNLFFGQNGLYTVALIGGGIALLKPRPVVAGVLLGLVSCKPQLAVLLPLLLVAGGHWRALGAAIVSQVLLAGASVAVLGLAPWIAFADKLLHPASVFSSSTSDWRAIPSVLILARTLGVGSALSTALHWSVALGAVGLALWSWRRTADAGIRAATAGAATVLVSPYLRHYDLSLLIPAIAFLASPRHRETVRTGPGPATVTVATIAWMAPGVLMFSSPPIQYGALVSLAVLLMVAWRLQPGAGQPFAPPVPQPK